MKDDLWMLLNSKHCVFFPWKITSFVVTAFSSDSNACKGLIEIECFDLEISLIIKHSLTNVFPLILPTSNGFTPTFNSFVNYSKHPRAWKMSLIIPFCWRNINSSIVVVKFSLRLRVFVIVSAAICSWQNWQNFTQKHEITPSHTTTRPIGLDTVEISVDFKV